MKNKNIMSTVSLVLITSNKCSYCDTPVPLLGGKHPHLHGQRPFPQRRPLGRVIAGKYYPNYLLTFSWITYRTDFLDSLLHSSI